MPIFCHCYEIPLPGVRQKTVAHFSDCHLSLADAHSTPEERLAAQAGEEKWLGLRPIFAETHREPCSAESAFSLFCALLAESATADAAVLTGDLVEGPDGASLRAVEAQLQGISAPLLSVCGNHEQPALLPDTGIWAKMKQPVQLLDLGDLLLVGLNNADRRATRSQIDTLRPILADGRPVVVAMHTPILFEDPGIVPPEDPFYYPFNYEGCPAENHELIELLLAEDSHVAAILTGHLHFGYVTELRPGLFQYGVAQGIGGHLHLYRIGDL